MTVKDKKGRTETYTVVGVDELDLEPDAVSWISPIGKALLAADMGDWITLEDGRAAKMVKIERISSGRTTKKQLRHTNYSAKGEKELERFRPEPTECSRCQHRINHAIQKMLERDYPASAAPNRFLDVGCAVSEQSGRADDTEHL